MGFCINKLVIINTNLTIYRQV